MTETLMLLSVQREPSALSRVVEVEDEKGETFLIRLQGCQSREGPAFISQVSFKAASPRKSFCASPHAKMAQLKKSGMVWRI